MTSWTGRWSESYAAGTARWVSEGIRLSIPARMFTYGDKRKKTFFPSRKYGL